jgi:hypothetical protein
MEKPQHMSFDKTPRMPWHDAHHSSVRTSIFAAVCPAQSPLFAFAAKFRILSTVAQISQPKPGRAVKKLATEF